MWLQPSELHPTSPPHLWNQPPCQNPPLFMHLLLLPRPSIFMKISYFKKESSRKVTPWDLIVQIAIMKTLINVKSNGGYIFREAFGLTEITKLSESKIECHGQKRYCSQESCQESENRRTNGQALRAKVQKPDHP
jgi:hypothetical protein